MPIWKAPIIAAGARAAAPLVTRAAQAIRNKITPPVVTPRAAQSARTADQIAQAAANVQRATKHISDATAARRVTPPLVTPQAGRTVAQTAAPVIRAAGTVAKATPLVAAGYGLARFTEPQKPPLVTPQAQGTTAPHPLARPDAVSGMAVTTPPLITPRNRTHTADAAPVIVGTMTPVAGTYGGQAMPETAQGFGYQTVTPAVSKEAALLADYGRPAAEVGQPLPGETPAFIGQGQNDLLAHIDQVANQNIGLAAFHTNQMMAMIDATEARIMEMYRQQGTALDPATLTALRSIREGVETRRRQLTDEMNRRGLLQSGIWLEMEDRIHRGQLTAEEDLLGRRLSDIQNRMSDAMMGFAQQRLNAMGTGMRDQRDIMRDAGRQGIDARQNFIDQQIDWTQWQQEQVARAAQWDRAYQQEERAAAETRRRWEAEQAAENARFTEDTRRWGQEHALRLRDQRLQERAATQAGGTLTERDRANFADAYSAVVTAMSAGTSPETIKNNIRAGAAELIRDGIDVNELLQTVDMLYLQRLQAQAPAVQQNQPGWYTGLDERWGGWLPYGAPRR